MRVISGKYRGKRLIAPTGKVTRPTTDRIKETIFNILVSKDKLSGAAVLDLFAGSGAMGIEALSRDALSCVFIEKNIDAVSAVKANLNNIGVAAQIYHTDYRVALPRFKESFDLVFLDPPYGQGIEDDAARKLAELNLINQNGLVVIEHSKENNLISLSDCYIIETRKCGATAVSFLSLKSGLA